MLELRTLGTLGLRHSAGTELRAVLKQPKRLALLGWLAIEVGDRWTRRDVLLGLFWPELDQSHARAALRRALFFLRQAVGEAVIEGRGDEELRIAPGSLWCDASEFERALGENRLTAALELYRGHLLEGFYIAGAPEAEEWLDRTRRRLKQRAVRAAWSLAEDPATPPAEAVEWGRRAAGFAPDDEESVRRLMTLLQRSGDRGGGLIVFDEYARRLRLDFDAVPSTELQALAQQIRQRPADPASQPESLVLVIPRFTQLASRTTPSLAALRTWLDAEEHFRMGQFLPALDAYSRTTEIDPDFALAHYRTASAAAASALIEPARAASRLAVERIAGLSERERLLVEAQDAWLHGRSDEAERRYAAVVANHPDDFEAWFLLGDLLFHGNPYRGHSIREARSALERALALDGNHVSTLVKLTRLAALDRDWSRLDVLVTRIAEQSPESAHTLGVRALRASVLGRAEEYREVLARLREAPALAIAMAFSDLSLYGKDLAEAERLGRELVELFRSAELQAFGHLVLASIAVARNDLTTGDSQLRLARQLDFNWSLEIRGLLAALPFVAWPQGWVEDTRVALQQWDPGAHRPNAGLPLAFHSQLHPHLRAYLLALLSARLNDAAGAAEAEETLAELEVPEDESAAVLVERLERSVRTELLVLRGEYQEALIELTGSSGDIWFQYAVASPFYGGAFERWRRSTLLRRLGREAEAQRWLGSIAERSPWELPFRLAQNRPRTAD